MDPVSGKSFEHRRTWIQNRLQERAASFGIDCLSFAVMVNHFHVILRNMTDVVAGWSDEEVARRWWQLFPLRKNKDRTAAVPTESELRSNAFKRRKRVARRKLERKCASDRYREAVQELQHLEVRQRSFAVMTD